MTKLRDQLKASKARIGQLYPILVDAETGEILDGRHRNAVDANWRKEEITIDGETEEERTLKRLAIKHHANWHRKSIDRQAVFTEIAEATGWRGLKPFAEFLGVSKDTVSRYLPQKYKTKYESYNNLVGPRSVRGINNLLSKMNWELSTWECLEERPEGYGDKSFHGNCSPTIIAALLNRYSSLNDDCILDPMVGSGTFIDVAKELGYRDDQIITGDIKPVREGIRSWDAAKTGLDNDSVDFVFTHFPYWKLIEYSEHSNDLSRMGYHQFLEHSARIFLETHRILKPNKFFAVMIGNCRESGILDLEAQFSIIGSKYFTLWDKIIKKIRTWNQETRGQRMGLAVARARQHNYSVVNHDTILVFRRE